MTYARPGSRSWGFRIDYAAAIADDERQIAQLTRMIEHGWYRRTLVGPYGTFEVVELIDLVTYFPAVAEAAGYSRQDVADLAEYRECNLRAIDPTLPEPTAGRAGYDRGKSMVEELRAYAWLPADEAEARLALHKAKASRARHKRNQAQYGAKP